MVQVGEYSLPDCMDHTELIPGCDLPVTIDHCAPSSAHSAFPEAVTTMSRPASRRTTPAPPGNPAPVRHPSIVPPIRAATPMPVILLYNSNPSSREQTPEIPDAASDFSSEPSDHQEVEGKIPKPKGEPGRPRSGGFGVAESLGWAEGEYRKVQVRMCEPEPSSPS